MNSTQRRIYERSIKADDRYWAQAKPRTHKRPLWWAEGWGRLVDKAFAPIRSENDEKQKTEKTRSA